MPVKRLINSKKILYRFLLLMFLLLGSASASYAAVATGYSEYYIPGDEVSMWTIFNSLDAAATTDMHAIISVTAWADNTTVYYDHWEDGYDFDPANPAATADQTVTLANAGDLQTFESANIPTAPRGVAQYYDGGDRIYIAGGAVTVTRASWIEAVGVGNQSAAWEIYPIKPQLTTYILPFGENLGFSDFNRVYVLIQATADNTTVTIDLDGNGTPDVLDQNRDGDILDPGDTATVTLQRGQTFLLDRVSANRPAGNITSGTIIQGNNTLQVKFVAGNPGQNYCARGFSAFPRGFWTKDYYAPLDQPTNGARGNTDYYLYNPNTSAITVTWESLSGSGSFNIPAGSTVSFRTATGGSVPIDSGLYFKSNDTFWGVGVGNASANAYEWGFSLLPSTMLYTEHFLGWAPGSIPIDIAGNPGNQDNDGVFLIAAQDNTRVWVDFNNDGASDLIDTDGNGTPESAYVTLNRLQTQFFYDPANAAGGGDLSQAHFWATGPFTMAYGENADTATTSTPSLDLGYVAIPGTDFISLVLTVDKTANPQVVPTAAGSTTTFSITVNSQAYTVDGITVVDYLPANWDFVNDSAVITLADMTTISGAAANPTKTGVGPFTLTWSSATLGNLAENQVITIVFTAQTTAPLATGTLSQNRVQADGTRTVGGSTQTFTATNFVYVISGDISISKTSAASTPAYPGDQFNYTVTVTNTSASTFTNVSVSDPMPAGLSYIGPLQVSRSTVGDRFGTAVYSNNNGTVNWSANWLETAEATNPTAGDIQIVIGELRLDNSASNEPTIRRRANLTGATSATLIFDYRTDTGVDAGDTIYIEAATADAGPFTIIGTFTGIAGASSGSFTGSLNAYISANTTIRFRFANNNYTQATENFYVDDLFITYDVPVTSPTIFPPDLINGYTLLAGQSITLTFLVSIDNPLATGIESITNTAFVTATQLPMPIGASVTNQVVNPSSSSAEVGDRVWLDTDGDGVLDVGESGLANIEVTLKDQFGTPLMTTITDGTGHYTFTGIAAGNGYYVEVTAGTLPPGLVQSAPAGHTDNKTDPFNLTASQSYMDADLGYKAAPGSAVIGNLVWSDADSDGLRDPGEPGIDNVTVQLWLDVNSDRIFDPAGADSTGYVTSVVTAPNGSYLFTGVTASGTEDYFVYIDESQAVLTGYSRTAPVFLPFYIENANAGAAYLSANFGYNSASTYSILDRVWYDQDGDGILDAGETGIELVTVDLLDASLNVIATAITDVNGNFSFNGVIGGGADYTMRITDTNGKLTDYYGTTTSAQTGTKQVINLIANVDYTSAPNFGYGLSSSIGSLVFNDADGDGIKDAGDLGFGGIVIRLYTDADGDGLIEAGDTVVATVATDVNGNYLFSGLNDGDYVVSLESPPAGYTYLGTDSDPGTAGHQQAANISGGSTVLDRNFRYQAATPRSVSGTVWNDTDADGTIDVTETGFAGVTLDLLLGGTVIASTSTAADGSYSFSGLASGAYTVRITDTAGVLSGLDTTFENTEGTTAPFNY